MTTHALALLPLALLCASARADEDAWANLSSRGELLLYRNGVDTWSDSPFRRVARVPDHSLNLELRPDLQWQADKLTLAAKPRFAARSEPGARHSAGWLNEGWLRWRPASGISLQAGREALLWGPASFWNPSNPFFSDNNKDNAKREVGGHDFVRARWQASQALSASLISQVDRGHDAKGTRRRDAIKLDWLGSEASAAALLSAEPGRRPDAQGWLQWTASDALLLYGEAAWAHAGEQLRARRAATPTGWQVGRAPQGYRFKGLLGAAYTFEINWTLNAELWRNGGGLRDSEAASIAAAARELRPQSPALADQQLGTLLQTDSPLRRNYAGLQLQNGSDAKTGWTLRYKRNLDDHSGEALVMLKRDLGDSLQLWANLMLRHGTRDSEYGRWVRRSSMLGLSWFMW